MIIVAPFSAEQVAALNNYQMWDVKPVRCKNGHKHPPFHSLGQKGVMIATIKGFLCPYCEYTQSWADEKMISTRRNPFDNLASGKINEVMAR